MILRYLGSYALGSFHYGGHFSFELELFQLDPLGLELRDNHVGAYLRRLGGGWLRTDLLF